MSVAFRTDSSLAIGTGHVMRCANLADRLGDGARFVCRDLPGHIAPRQHPCILLPAGHAAATPDASYAAWLGTSEEQDAADTIAALRDNPPDWLVVDHYALGAAWHARVKEALGCRLLVIDDLADRPLGGDALLDQNYRRDALALYRPLTSPGTRFFLGPRYALLQDAFFTTKPSPRCHATPRRLFVFFGGVDFSGETLRTLQALPDGDLEVEVVCGSKNPRLEAIADICRMRDYRLHTDTSDMAGLIAACDAGIGGGGVNTWERAFLQLPTLVMSVAENQEPTARDTHDAGFIHYLGRAQDISDAALAAGIAAFLADTAGRTAIAQRCAAYFSASGLKEIVDVMNA